MKIIWDSDTCIGNKWWSWAFFISSFSLSLYLCVTSYNDWQANLTITTLKVKGWKSYFEWMKEYSVPGRCKANNRAWVPFSNNLLSWAQHGGCERSDPWGLQQLEEGKANDWEQHQGTTWWVYDGEVRNERRRERHLCNDPGDELAAEHRRRQSGKKQRCSRIRVGWVEDRRGELKASSRFNFSHSKNYRQVVSVA